MGGSRQRRRVEWKKRDQMEEKEKKRERDLEEREASDA